MVRYLSLFTCNGKVFVLVHLTWSRCLFMFIWNTPTPHPHLVFSNLIWYTYRCLSQTIKKMTNTGHGERRTTMQPSDPETRDGSRRTRLQCGQLTWRRRMAHSGFRWRRSFVRTRAWSTALASLSPHSWEKLWAGDHRRGWAKSVFSATHRFIDATVYYHCNLPEDAATQLWTVYYSGFAWSTNME